MQNPFPEKIISPHVTEARQTSILSTSRSAAWAEPLIANDSLIREPANFAGPDKRFESVYHEGLLVHPVQ